VGSDRRRTKAGGVDVTLFLGVQVVFRHVGKPVEHAEPADGMDDVAGFLHHLAGQRDLRAFTGVDAAAGQLKLGPGFFLKSREDAVARVDDRVDPGTRRIALPGKGRSAKSAVHGGSG
jgi:hypothetical protein